MIECSVTAITVSHLRGAVQCAQLALLAARSKGVKCAVTSLLPTVPKNLDLSEPGVIRLGCNRSRIEVICLVVYPCVHRLQVGASRARGPPSDRSSEKARSNARRRA